LRETPIDLVTKVINVNIYNISETIKIIDVYVNYLRNKVDRGFPQKLIHTVRGVGYILKEGDKK